MSDLALVICPPLVTLPAEIDMANTDGIGQQLAAAFTPGVRVVIADMTATAFCNSLGIGMLVSACRQACANGRPLRLLLSCPGVLRIINVLGVDVVLPIYQSLEEALADSG